MFTIGERYTRNCNRVYPLISKRELQVDYYLIAAEFRVGWEEWSLNSILKDG